MIHLRIVAPSEHAEKALALLCAEGSAFNVVALRGAAKKPPRDVILCDVSPEDASVIIGDLKELGIPAVGSIAIEKVDSEISEAGKLAERHAPGMPTDAVVWEEVEARTSENVEVSWNYVAFMVLAVLIAMAGIFLDSPILASAYGYWGEWRGAIAPAMRQPRDDRACRCGNPLSPAPPLPAAPHPTPERPEPRASGVATGAIRSLRPVRSCFSKAKRRVPLRRLGRVRP